MNDRFRFRFFWKNTKGDGMLIGTFDITNPPIEIIQDPCTVVVQCTGLKDKNGTLIFEGDILGADERWFTPIVGYENGMFTVDNLGPTMPVFEYLEQQGEDFNVIGNIYENRNLIGRG